MFHTSIQGKKASKGVDRSDFNYTIYFHAWYLVVSLVTSSLIYKSDIIIQRTVFVYVYGIANTFILVFMYGNKIFTMIFWKHLNTKEYFREDTRKNVMKRVSFKEVTIVTDATTSISSVENSNGSSMNNAKCQDFH